MLVKVPQIYRGSRGMITEWSTWSMTPEKSLIPL